MASAMDGMNNSVSVACSGSAPAGVNSALAVIVNYCGSNGFAVTTFSGEPTGTTAVPFAPSVLPSVSISLKYCTHL